MRARNPWVFARFLTFGWYVRFTCSSLARHGFGAKPDEYMRGVRMVSIASGAPSPPAANRRVFSSQTEANTRSKIVFSQLRVPIQHIAKPPQNLWILWKTQESRLWNLWITFLGPLWVSGASCYHRARSQHSAAIALSTLIPAVRHSI
jgi:hypothetical protein